MNSTYQITCTADMHITPSPSWFSELASQDLSVLSCLFLWLAENYFLWLWRLNTKKFNWKKNIQKFEGRVIHDWKQCDQIGRFLKVFGYQKWPKYLTIFLATEKSSTFKVKTAAPPFWALFGNLRLLFIPPSWSHWLEMMMSLCCVLFDFFKSFWARRKRAKLR